MNETAQNPARLFEAIDWLYFEYKGARLGGYTLEGSFLGEFTNTLNLCAAENKIEASQIEVRHVRTGIFDKLLSAEKIAEIMELEKSYV